MEENDCCWHFEEEGAEPEQVPFTDAQKQDLERRLAAQDLNPSAGSTWDEVKGRVESRSFLHFPVTGSWQAWPC